MKHWFAVHMVLGIGGPVLVLAHSTFHMRSTNAAVALICMLVVAGSGIIGRFLYVKVHRGLYGEKLSLQELQVVAGLENREVRSRLFFVPEVEKRIRDFEAYAMPAYRSFLRDARRFLYIGVRRMIVYQRCKAEIRSVLGRRAPDPARLPPGRRIPGHRPARGAVHRLRQPAQAVARGPRATA